MAKTCSTSMPTSLRALALLGERADRAAEIGLAHDQPQQGGGDQRAGEGDDLGQRQEGAEDLDDLEGIGHVDDARVGLEEKQREILDHDGEAERHQQDIFVPSVAGAADDAALQRIAEREHAGRYDQERHVRVDPELDVEIIDRVEAKHQQRPMGEVDDVQNAVDQRQAEGDEGIERTCRQPVQHGRNDDRHVGHGHSQGLSDERGGRERQAPPASITRPALSRPSGRRSRQRRTRPGRSPRSRRSAPGC
jgi:hypothetical protein